MVNARGQTLMLLSLVPNSWSGAPCLPPTSNHQWWQPQDLEEGIWSRNLCLTFRSNAPTTSVSAGLSPTSSQANPSVAVTRSPTTVNATCASEFCKSSFYSPPSQLRRLKGANPEVTSWTFVLLVRSVLQRRRHYLLLHVFQASLGSQSDPIHTMQKQRPPGCGVWPGQGQLRKTYFPHSFDCYDIITLVDIFRLNHLHS